MAAPVIVPGLLVVVQRRYVVGRMCEERPCRSPAALDAAVFGAGLKNVTSQVLVGRGGSGWGARGGSASQIMRG